MVSLHAFWFALILPGGVGGLWVLNSIRSWLIWLAGAAICAVYLTIFSLPELSGIVSGTSEVSRALAQILYRLITTPDLPIVQVATTCLLNWLLVVSLVKRKPLLTQGEKTNEPASSSN